MGRRFLTAVVASALLSLTGCAHDKAPEGAERTPATAPDVDAADVIVRRDDLPADGGWQAVGTAPKGADGFDACAARASEGFRGTVVSEDWSGFRAGLSFVSSYAAVATEPAAADWFGDLGSTVLPCMEEELREATSAEEAVRVLPTRTAETGTYDVEVFARTAPTEFTSPSPVDGILPRLDLFALQRGGVVLVVHLLANDQLTPAGEDDVLAAAAGRMGVERLQPLR